jgi:hypothetical protein
MAQTPRKGCFHKFDRKKKGNEIGPQIDRNAALARLRNKEDVYTLMQSDAKSLAKDAQKGKAPRDGAHEPDYYAHFHPAGNHDCHVFYGSPGLRYDPE